MDRTTQDLAQTIEMLEAQKQDLQTRLDEAEEALRAIRGGEVDALVVYAEGGERIYTLEGADHAYRMMVETIPEGAATLLNDGTVLYSNRRLAEMLGVPLSSLLGSSLYTYLPGSDRENFSALVRKALMQPGRIEMTLQCTGRSLPVLISMNPAEVNDQPCICLIATDLTEQKRNEEIMAAERMARSILEQSAEVVVVCDVQGAIIRASHSTHTLLSANPLYRPFDEVFALQFGIISDNGHPFSIQDVLAGASFKGLEAHLAVPSRQDLQKVETVHLLVSAAPLRTDSGEVLGCILSLTDMTEIQSTKKMLRESQERLLRTAEHSEVGLWSWDMASGLVEADERAKALFGLDKKHQITLETYKAMLLPFDREKLETGIKHSLESRKPFDMEYHFIWPDGTRRWIYLRGQAEYDEAGQPLRILGIALDSTHRRQIEDEIRSQTVQIELQHRLMDQREKERMQIARDLHDGPVQDLVSILYTLQAVDSGSTPEAMLKSVANIKAAIQGMIHDLRDYTGELRPPTLMKFGLEKAISSHLVMLRERHPEITFKMDVRTGGMISSESVRLAAYRIYAEVLTNVVRHSRASEVLIRVKKDEEDLILSIQDNGTGFDVPEDWLDLAHRGHLGLIGIQERAEAVGGSVIIESEPGKGTHVTVIVPDAYKGSG